VKAPLLSERDVLATASLIWPQCAIAHSAPMVYGALSLLHWTGAKYVRSSMSDRTVDVKLWFQANYQFSRYIAEVANSFSNLYSIGLALFGVLITRSEALPMRYTIGYMACVDDFILSLLFLILRSGICPRRHWKLCIPRNHALRGSISRRNTDDLRCERRLLYTIQH
jgi:hypothetical protein